MHLGNRHTSPSRPITPDPSQQRHFSFKPAWMQKFSFHSIFVRDESRCQSPDTVGDVDNDVSPWPSMSSDDQPKFPRAQRESTRPITGLPRQTTFKRQNSERRERLCPIETPPEERRALSASRHVSTSCVRRRRTRSSPPPVNPCRSSAPAATTATTTSPPVPPPQDTVHDVAPSSTDDEPSSRQVHDDSVFDYEERSSRPLSRSSSVSWYDQRDQLQLELDTRWILNLSMHFRDKSDREKFFVTYAETPTKWRRVTVSCDYRHAESGSLEMDLKELQSQRDKSLAIYEAIRESLPEIQFYDTVTNLKLETSEGRLHVHVTEDVNEIIPYPPRSLVRHILDDDNLAARPMEVCEKDIAFDAHLSGFVYRVWHQNKVYIKKEIPSPDTIEEFLYEINALHALYDSKNVIKLEAIILDDTRQIVKGLLISLAEKGAVVDILYDNKGTIPWEHRELWARQAVTGLRDIHEEGYVQGDFTLSNIVVDEDNNAKIIDINRRGCPVGWEPPEIAQKIASNQRISMYIGEKSDLYQLGMTLWALAMDDDEPERHDPPLMTDDFPLEIPDWFRNMVRICLSPKPKDRLSAKELVKLFPIPTEPAADVTRPMAIPPRPHPIPRPEPKQYIDPNDAVERDDLERFKSEEDLLYSPQSSKGDWTFTYPRSSEYDIESSASAFDGVRGRAPASRIDQLSIDDALSRPYDNPMSQEGQLNPSEPQIFEFGSLEEPGYEKLEDDGNIRQVQNANSNVAESRVTKDYELPAGCLTTMTLAPTLMPKSPSPFRLPNWRRSASESTPRNSRIRLMSESFNNSPEISPRSTTLALPTRIQTAGSTTSDRSSHDTIPGCDFSVAGTTSSAKTSISHTSECEHMQDKANSVDLASISNSSSVSTTLALSIEKIPELKFDDSNYDEPIRNDEKMTATGEH